LARWYFGEGNSPRYRGSPQYKQVQASYTSIASGIAEAIEKEEGPPVVFTKDISYFLTGRINAMTVPPTTRHTFIVRDPAAAIKSLYSKSCVDNAKTGWSYFDPGEAGFKQQHDIFTYVKDVLQQTPVVVDAADLLRDPPGVMREYCDAVGMRYTDDMLTWPAGPVAEWGPIEEREPGWHDDAINSTGITQSKNNHGGKSSPADLSHLPREVIMAIEEATPLYEAMREYRVGKEAASTV
jgi:hypothetical protein